MQARVLVLDEDKIKQIMQEADIPGVSIAFISGGEIHIKGISLQDNEQANNVMRDAVFGAASLSKPIFAYLVLALIKSNHYHFNLDTKLVDLLPVDQFSKKTGYQLNEFNPNWMGNITVNMLLSHTSGLHFSDANKIEFLFEPGTEYAYSNPGLFYLQKAIEARTKQPLEPLARTYVFDQIGMSEKSTFYRAYELKEMPDNLQDCAHAILYVKETKTGLQYKVKGLDGEDKNNTIPWNAFPDDFPRNVADIIQHKDKYLKLLLRHTALAGHTSQPEAIAVFSLFTTAYDYALFVKAWMELKKTQDQLMALAFEPDISMNKDKWARDFGIPDIHLSHLASGLTWELETDDLGVPVRAYKTGDMDLWRAWAAIDFAEGNEAAIIYFANSENGHLLANQIVFPNVPLKHAPSFFFTKWGFAKELESNWKVKEHERIQEIIAYEHGYKLDVMPEDTSNLAHGVIYLKASVAGLSYTVFAPTSELKINTISWNKLPEDFPKDISDISAIIKNSKQCLPIILTHTQQADHTRQPRSSVIAKDFYEMLKIISIKEPLVSVFFENYLSHHDQLSFATIVKEYARYFSELTDQADKKKLSLRFWEVIESVKLPIIEVGHDGSAQVYFLYRKQEENGKDIYIQGDFHGYGSTLSSQRLKRLGDTDVMCCITPMEKELRDALITYHFVEVPPKHQNQKADYFYKEYPELKNLVDTHWLPDPYAKHTKAFEMRERQFCVNAENDIASWRASELREWPSLDETLKDPRITNWIQTPDHQILEGIASLFTDKHNLRTIHVFKPSEKVENIIIVNDGVAYLLSDMVNQLQKFAEKEKCAFIFIGQLYGLGNPNDHPLGLRGLDYHIHIDQYSAFILEELLPELHKKGVLPNPRPTNMTVIGASLSGTAALRMGLTHPDEFKRVIAYSPAPIGRDMIDEIPDARLKASQMRIDIEVGKFENPDNAQNDNVSYAHELGRLLKIDVRVGLHGHQYEGWVVDLKRSLPAIHSLEQKKSKKQSFTSIFSQDDLAIQTAADEKRKKEYASQTDKKTTDDSSIAYYRPSKK